MNTNSKQSTDKTRSGAVCRIIGVVFFLYAFIWLPKPEVDAASKIFGVVRDANTSISLPGVTITVKNDFNDDFSTVSKGPPDAGEYAVNYEGCNFSIKTERNRYKLFESGPFLFFACPEDFEFNLDIKRLNALERI